MKIGSTCWGNTNFGSVGLPTTKMSMKEKKNDRRKCQVNKLMANMKDTELVFI